MTNEQIKKALKCCRNGCPIGDCPYYGIKDCENNLLKDTIELITEQEEHIKIQNQQLSNWEKNYTQSFERLKAQQREIDTLKADNKQGNVSKVFGNNVTTSTK